MSGLAALVILCVASLALFTIYVREGDSGPLHTIQLGASEVLRPVRGLLNLATSPFSAASERIEGAVDTSEKKKELEEKALEYEEGAADAARLRQENERLRSLLQGEQPTFEYGPLARVIQPVGGQLTDRVVINVGTNDGVGPEQPVVVGNNALVGRTTSRVTPNTAEVLLITDQSFAAGVRIVPPEGSEDESEETTSAGGGPSEEESHGEGLLRTSWEGYLGVDYVDLDAGAVQGDFVVTSGRAGNRELIFPPGLLVGTVESAISQDIEQYMKIVVAPTVQADDLQEVRVIVGW
ncbi:MAG: rod shape-determining protein MreC [Actinomycetota bacterium]|nr:rod shape-determining protein MreC [Actinomycetota bacterium]